MNHKVKIIILMLLGILLLTGTALAADAGAYQINWWTVDGGGGASQSADGQYALQGTVGQPEAGAIASGGSYTVQGGFWQGLGAAIQEFLIHLPLVNR